MQEQLPVSYHVCVKGLTTAPRPALAGFVAIPSGPLSAAQFYALAHVMRDVARALRAGELSAGEVIRTTV